MSIVGLLCLLFALVAALVLVLYALQRRDVRSLRELSQQLQRIASDGRGKGRLDLESDRPVALKLIRGDLLGNPALVERFCREVKSAARLASHPHIVSAYDAEQAGDFLAEYGTRVREAYPPRPFGTIFPFRRVFAVAHRPA